MTISGPDISSYEGGLKIQPGTAFVIAKATEGVYYRDAYFTNFKSQSISVGAVFSGYHFVKQEGSAAAQAQYYHDFAGTTPVMLDVEKEAYGSGGYSMPGMVEIMSFINTTKALGGRPWGVYLPHWYWQEIGSPDLTPIVQAGSALVSSAYDYVGADNGPGWAPYGGVTPAMWQYTDKLNYGGYPCDFNAYKGTVADFNAMVNGGSSTPVPAGQPVVSLIEVQRAAAADPARPQGGTTDYNAVIWVERALNAEGLLASQYVDGSYGTMTIAAYKLWQQRLGYTGADADGIPGKVSLSKLGGAHGFTVVA